LTRRGPKVALLVVALLFLTGCSHPGSPAKRDANSSTEPKLAAPATQAPTSPVTTPLPSAPQVLSVSAVPDPSLAAADMADPYDEMNRYVREVFHPDPGLYNVLFRAIDAMEPSVDISSFHVDGAQMVNMRNCLYSEEQFRFYYLKTVRLSKDGKVALFTYNGDTPAEVKRNKETFCARLSHLLYNVAPDGYTDLQKTLSVYDYVCRNTTHTPDSADQMTFNPYSILMQGEGICQGFATLVDYTLNHADVATEYVCNDVHAWNIVTVEGKRYHLDVTYGTGTYGDMSNSLSTVLMDDQVRLDTLQSDGADIGQIILGDPRENPTHPAPCTDTSMATYNSITSCYALHVDGGDVYFASEDGIKRMNLDCTGLETVSPASAFGMAVYDGVLYFLDGHQGQLYRLAKNGTPELLDSTKNLAYIDVVDGTLRYSTKYDGSDFKSIRLTSFDPRAWNGADAVKLPTVVTPRSRSFALRIEFSEPMDTTASWMDMVFLADEQGHPLPTHLLWSEDGKVLTLRPKECVADMGSIILMVKSGASAVGGGALEKRYEARVDIKAGE
jgi:hypothetical protein